MRRNARLNAISISAVVATGIGCGSSSDQPHDPPCLDCRSELSERPIASTARLTVPLHAVSPLTFKTQGNALCNVHAAGDRDGLKVRATEDGVVSLQLRPDQATENPVPLIADCEAGGLTMRHILELSAAHGAPPVAQSNDDVEFAETRPPLPDDLLDLSQEELDNRGYPPRPDRTRAPEQYRNWRNFVSRPTTRVFSRTKATSATELGLEIPNGPRGRHRSAAPTLAPTASAAPGQVLQSKRAGWQLLPGGVPYYFAYAVWTAPEFFPRAGVGTRLLAHAGINDDAAGHALAVGTGQHFYYVIGIGHVGESTTFCTFFPNGSMENMGVPVRVNDVIAMAAWTGDASNGFSPWSTHGQCYLENATTGQWAKKTVQFGDVDLSNNGTHFLIDRIPGGGQWMDLTKWLKPGQGFSGWRWAAAESSRWDGVVRDGAYFDQNPQPGDVLESGMWCPDSPTEFCSQARAYADKSLDFFWDWWNGSWAD